VISGPKSDRQTTIDIHGRTRRRETVRDKNADGKYPDDGKRKQKHAEANAARRERVGGPRRLAGGSLDGRPGHHVLAGAPDARTHPRSHCVALPEQISVHGRSSGMVGTPR